jgi:hypothetical protein
MSGCGYMAADLVGGTVGLAIAHAFEAAYTAQTIAKIVNPITQQELPLPEGIRTRPHPARIACHGQRGQQPAMRLRSHRCGKRRYEGPQSEQRATAGLQSTSDDSSQSRQEHLADCKTGVTVDR